MTLYSSTRSNPNLMPVPIINLVYSTIEVEQSRKRMNYSQGTAAFCLDTITLHTDIMVSREIIRKEKIEGKSIEKRISEQTGTFSAGKTGSCGLFRIGQTIFDRIHQNTVNAKKIVNEKGEAARLVL